MRSGPSRAMPSGSNVSPSRATASTSFCIRSCARCPRAGARSLRRFCARAGRKRCVAQDGGRSVAAVVGDIQRGRRHGERKDAEYGDGGRVMRARSGQWALYHCTSFGKCVRSMYSSMVGVVHLFPRSVSSPGLSLPPVCLFPGLSLPPVCRFAQFVSSPSLSLLPICLLVASSITRTEANLAIHGAGEDAHRASCLCILLSIPSPSSVCDSASAMSRSPPYSRICAVGIPSRPLWVHPSPRPAQSPLAHEPIMLKANSPTQTKKLRACLRRRAHVPVFDFALSSMTWLLAASLSRASRDALQWRRLSIARGS
jgi:hypothetical protein